MRVIQTGEVRRSRVDGDRARREYAQGRLEEGDVLVRCSDGERRTVERTDLACYPRVRAYRVLRPGRPAGNWIVRLGRDRYYAAGARPRSWGQP